MYKLILLGALVVLSGCASLAGNANYKVSCPVIGQDGFIATTAPTVGPDGNVVPGRVAVSEFEVDSGRTLSAGAKIKVPGCFEFDATALEQGEDRTPGIIGAGVTLLRGLAGLLFGG